MKYFIFGIFLLVLFSCKKENDSPLVETETIQDSIKLTKKDVSSIDFREFVLGKKGEKAVEGWKNYSEIANIINDVKQANFSYFKNNSEVINAFVKDFKSTVPESIDAPSINARITVIETKLYKLESAINLNTTTKSSLLLSIKEFLQAVSNLHLQINKKFEKEGQHIEKP